MVSDHFEEWLTRCFMDPLQLLATTSLISQDLLRPMKSVIDLSPLMGW